VLIFTD